MNTTYVAFGLIALMIAVLCFHLWSLAQAWKFPHPSIGAKYQVYGYFASMTFKVLGVTGTTLLFSGWWMILGAMIGLVGSSIIFFLASMIYTAPMRKEQRRREQEELEVIDREETQENQGPPERRATVL